MPRAGKSWWTIPQHSTDFHDEKARIAIVGLGMAVVPHAKSLIELSDRVEVAYAFSPSPARRASSRRPLRFRSAKAWRLFSMTARSMRLPCSRRRTRTSTS